MKVTVFHNVARDECGRSLGFFGYEPGHEMAEVFSYEVPDAPAMTVAANAFWLFNVGDDPGFGGPDPIAVRYREEQLRSLSVGDVIVMTDSAASSAAYACAPDGWTPLDGFPSSEPMEVADGHDHATR